MDRISNRQTTWHLINIKARREQNTSHYVDVFRRLYDEDPLISLPREKCESLKSMTFSESLDENHEPKWIKAILLSYTIIDPNAFYNKRSQEDVNMDDWDSDIVANKKEAELFFIPSVHTLVVRRNSAITLDNIVLYLSEALNRIEPDMFDVDIIVERDILDRILNAHAVYFVEANISFSNPGHTNGFISAFDNKLRSMDPDKFTIVAKGSKDHPLINEDDGMLPAIVNMSERDGNYKLKTKYLETESKFVNDICLPKKLYMLSGVQNDIFVQPFIKRWKPFEQDVRFSGTASYFRRLKRVASINAPIDNATVIATLTERNFFKSIKSLTSTIVSGTPSVGTNQIVCSIIGDSITNGAFFKDALLTKGYVPNIKLIGLRKSFRLHWTI